MAFVRLAMFPGGTEESHNAVVEGLGEAHHSAPGRLLFAAGPGPEGWNIVQVWESSQHMERWVDEHLGRAFAHAGERGHPSPPQIIDFEAADIVF